MPLDGSSSFNDGTISLVLITNQVVVLSDNRWVCLHIYRLTRVLSWQMVVEKTKTISAIRVSNVVTELAEAHVLRADVGIEGGSNRSDLQIVPVTVSVGASGVVVTNDVVWIGDPDARC